MASAEENGVLNVLPVALTSEILPGVTLGAPAAVSLVNDSDDEDELLGYDAAGDINEAVPRDSTEAVPLPAARPETDTVRASWIRSEVCRLWGQPRLLQTCPGPNPVCVERKHLAWIRDGEYEYVVAEKTDGVRYLLCCCRASDLRDSSDEQSSKSGAGGTPEEGRRSSETSRNVSFMVDRAFDAYEVQLCGAPVEMYDGTLLDGELVREESGELKFLVYDCVALYGHHVGNVEDYIARLDVLSSLFSMDALPVGSPPPLLAARPLSEGPTVRVAGATGTGKAAGSSSAEPPPHSGFSVLLKPIFSACHAAHVMHMAGFPDAPLPEGAAVPQRFPHQSDGIILTPRNLEVVTGTNWPMLKWKGENNPIDLLLEASIGDNAQEWADYANPIISAKRRAGRTLRSIVDTLRVGRGPSRDSQRSDGSGKAKREQQKISGASSAQSRGGRRRSPSDSPGALDKHKHNSDRRHATKGTAAAVETSQRHGDEADAESLSARTDGGAAAAAAAAATRPSRWSMAVGAATDVSYDNVSKDHCPSPVRGSRDSKHPPASSGDDARAKNARVSGSSASSLAAAGRKTTVGLGRGVIVRALIVNNGSSAGQGDGTAKKRGRNEGRNDGRYGSRRSARSRSNSSSDSSSGSGSGSSSDGSSSSRRRRRRRKGTNDGSRARKKGGDRSASDSRWHQRSSSAERRAEARRLRQERKDRALKAAVKLHKEAQRIQKRAQLRFAMLAQAAAPPPDATAGIDDVNDDILDQPESIHWRLRLLYREGRSFKDAASGFPYSGYMIKFCLENSPMLRAVLAGFEALVREQYLHVRRARLADHRARGEAGGAASASLHARTTADVPSVRAVGVVVECDTKLNLERQVMKCTVVRARQDKLDPNCRLTITRTLGAIIEPVCAADLVRALVNAPVVPREGADGGLP